MESSKAGTVPAREPAKIDRPSDPAYVHAAKPLDEWGRVRELALHHLDRFISLEPKVLRGDDPDAIHDMRVASRRLQQVLDLLHPPPPPDELRVLRRKIRRARRALSDTRNCDVLIQRVRPAAHRKRSARREIWTAVEHFLLARRAESFERALRKLSKVNLAVFYIHLRRFLVPVEGDAPAEHRRAHHGNIPMPSHPVSSAEFYQRIGDSLAKTHQAFRSQVELAEREPSAPVVHGVRIAAKRLRYLVEVLADFDVQGSSESLAWLRGLQTHLGNWHDFEILEELMIEMVARPHFLRDHLELSLGVEKLILKNRGTKREFLDRYFQMLQEPEGPRNLNDWVAYVLASPSAAFTKG